jgi:transketolase
VHQCLEAAEQLEQEGISARVMDLYSLKPIDTGALRQASEATHGRFVIVEDHYPEGGVAGAVLEAMAESSRPPRVVHLAVRDLPGSGSTADLLRAARIDAPAIVEAARELAKPSTR